MIKSIPIGVLKVQNIPAKIGVQVETEDSVGRIIEVNDERVKLDFNPPLAGRTLIFELKIEELRNEK